MTRLAALYIACATFTFLGCQIVEPWISPSLERAAKAFIERELGARHE